MPTRGSADAAPANMPDAGGPELGALPRRLLAAALDACPVALSIEDGDGRVIAANAAAHALLSGAEAPAQTAAGHANASDIAGTQSQFVCGDRSYTLTAFSPAAGEPDTERELLRLAYIDSLTGLPNRMLLQEHVADLIGAAGSEAKFALAFIDLDNFKYVNDYYGHAIGDALLKKTGDRIVSCLRETDMLARVGGDEFVLLISPISDEKSACRFVLDIAEKLKQPHFIDGYEIFASASIGISIYPIHGADFDSLRRQADSAMYKAKHRAKGGVVVFDNELDAEASSRMAVEQRLRLAIRDCRICCAFQPKVEMRSGQVKGVEVLLRWRDEEGMIQAPGEFVNLAVELGLINEIAFRVLTETVRSVAIVDETFGPEASISLNVAAKQAADATFMTDYIDSIVATGFPQRFILELTEEAFFTKGPFQSEIIPHIKDAGIRVSIDDFGVGYSSLGSLAEIHADELKVDRSFITRIHERKRSQLVLKAIVELGMSLDMDIVAEGIETQEEAEYLIHNTSIVCGQGYFFGRPAVMPSSGGDDLFELVRLGSSDQRWMPLHRRPQHSRQFRLASGW